MQQLKFKKKRITDQNKFREKKTPEDKNAEQIILLCIYTVK
jgi:hypothetical protein